mgnify:CR=1 FL=1
MPEAESTIQLGLRGIDYATIAAYMVGTFGIAVWFSRRQKTTEDFFVGGRSMPWFAVGLSILATLFSTLTYLALPGEIIGKGIGFIAGYCALPFAAIVILKFWIPFFMRLRLVSAYEYLERRFSYPVRLVGAVLFILLRLGWMSMVVYAASMALDRVKGPDFAGLPGRDLYWVIGAIGLAAAVYAAVGGIQAMIWIDVLQCLLLLAGVLLAIGFVAFKDGTGPIAWLHTARDHGLGSIEVVDFNITVRVTMLTAFISIFFWEICTHGSDQVVLQRYFSTSSLRAARRSYLTNLGVNLLMALLLAMAGLALLSFFVNHRDLWPTTDGVPERADRLFPHFLGSHLPPGCAGLVIAAFLCDAIQTLEAGVNSITAVATNDLVPRLRRGGRRRFSELGFVRVMVVGVCLVVTCNAYFVSFVIDAYKYGLMEMLPKFFNLFVGPLASMFFIGMFLPRATTRTVLPSVAVGMTVAVLWNWWAQIVGTHHAWWRATFGSGDPPTFLLAIAVPTLTTFGTAALLSLVVERGGWHPGHDYTWRAVLRRPPNEGGAMNDDR